MSLSSVILDVSVLGQPRSYALAVLSVGVAAGGLLLFQRFGFRPPAGMLMLIAAAINYWYGERGPALLWLILTFPCMCYLLVEPHDSFHIASSDIAYLITFLSLAGRIWWFVSVGAPD